ncbi:MAG TPA: LysR family transcriptional regulator [Desulfobulbus sp.]|nr:LysR family transcriptional regulator [Desulfobulbus sp.]
MNHTGSNMELYQLKSFVTVAGESHLTRAAEKLNTSQPSVSAHIKALEEEFGFPLFVRTAKGMQLTAAGKLLRTKAQKILQDVEELTGLGENLLNQPTGILRIGLNRNAEFLRISPLYQQLRDNYPNLEIVLHQSISGTILKMIKTDELDCGFVLGSCAMDDLTLLPLAEFKLRIVGPTSLQTRLEKADLSGLAQLPWIGIPNDCPYSGIMEQYFHARGLYPKTEVVADQQSAIVSMIESGVGLNFMLEEEATCAREQGRVALWPGGSFPIKLSFAYRTREHHSSRLQAIRKTMAAIWPQL